jgi:hypothetical protein
MVGYQSKNNRTELTVLCQSTRPTPAATSTLPFSFSRLLLLKRVIVLATLLYAVGWSDRQIWRREP